MSKRVPAQYAYLEEPTDSGGEVVAWFRASTPHAEGTADDGAINFSFGPLSFKPDGALDEDLSPIVSVVPPRIVRGVLWTAGFVIFRPVLKESGLAPLNRSFASWLKQHELIFHSHRNATNLFDYYLEGGTRNWSTQIYALPSGASAIRRGRYFVAHQETDARLDIVCRSLRLRGVECSS